MKIHLYSFIFMLITLGAQGQNLKDTSSFKDCNSVQENSYDFLILGKDTLRYFVCSKFITHYALDKSPCYTADVIFPGFSKKKNDFNGRELAFHLMTKYNLFEIRMFKTCRVRDLAWMAARPPDPVESSKIDRKIKKNSKTFRKSVIEIR